MDLRTFFNRYLEPAPLRFISISILAVVLTALVYSCFVTTGEKTLLGTHIERDYDALYVAGMIMNEYGPKRLYDIQLQTNILHRLKPYLPEDYLLPYPYPPFFTLFFWPLARLPFLYSYLTWLAVSTCLYIIGLTLIFKTTKAIPRRHLTTCFLLALSFEPFIIECWLSGQTSSFGFFSLALAFYFYHRHKHIWAGIALGLCLYKPTLLVFVLPLLLIGRQWKTILGFILSAVSLGLISITVFGYSTCVQWIEFSRRLAEATTRVTVFDTYKYMDIVSFWRLMFGDPNLAGRIIILILCITSFAVLVLTLKKAATDKQHCHKLALACALTFTTVFNIYIPVHDTIIIVLSVLLTVDAYYSVTSSESFDPKLKALLVLIYIMPGISQAVAKYVGFLQPYTVVLVLLGIYQLFLLRRFSKTSR